MEVLITILRDHIIAFILPLILLMTFMLFSLQLAWLKFSGHKNGQQISSNYKNTASINTDVVDSPEPYSTPAKHSEAISLANETDMRDINFQTQPEFMQSENFGSVEIISCSEEYSGPKSFILKQSKMIFGFTEAQNPRVDIALPHPHVSGQHFSIICYGRSDYHITNLSQRHRAMVLYISDKSKIELKSGQTERLYRGDVYAIRDDMVDLKLRFNVLAVSRQDLTE